MRVLSVLLLEEEEETLEEEEDGCEDRVPETFLISQDRYERIWMKYRADRASPLQGSSLVVARWSQLLLEAAGDLLAKKRRGGEKGVFRASHPGRARAVNISEGYEERRKETAVFVMPATTEIPRRLFVFAKSRTSQGPLKTEKPATLFAQARRTLRGVPKVISEWSSRRGLHGFNGGAPRLLAAPNNLLSCHPHSTLALLPYTAVDILPREKAGISHASRNKTKPRSKKETILWYTRSGCGWRRARWCGVRIGNEGEFACENARAR
ncbi:hypothetical protein MRX96_044245 [Rhipicephalus microplus]